MTIMREIIKGRDSPVKRYDTRVGDIRKKRNVERQVGIDQPPRVEEQSRSKVNVLQKQGRIHEKGRKL